MSELDREWERKRQAERGGYAGCGTMPSFPQSQNEVAGKQAQGYNSARNEASRPSIVERAYQALNAEAQSQQRADAARRLLALNEKHPEVLELLDLLQQL